MARKNRLHDPFVAAAVSCFLYLLVASVAIDRRFRAGNHDNRERMLTNKRNRITK